MQKEQFFEILKKYREGKASKEEKAFLLAYYNLFETEPEILESLSSAETDKLKSDIRHNIRRRARQHEQAAHANRKIIVRIAAAASICILIAIGVYFRINKEPQQQPLSSVENDISPGGNKALLTLADGSQVILDTLRNGVLTSRNGVRISKTDDGQLAYDLSGGAENEDATGFNRIETPKGGQYRVILPDGSLAWLNAKSSIRFPVAFGDASRQVEIKGEVYFEVELDENKPFKVTVAAQQDGEDDLEIEVLGTHFNVMAYEDEAAVKTTLLEGSILVSKGSATGNPAAQNPSHPGSVKSDTQHSMLLKPGQQAAVSRNTGEMRIGEAHTEAAVAWKNGYFMFANEPLQSIMRKIARWYDVKVEYQGEIPQKVFGGTVSKFENVSEVLNMLELTGSVHFKIEAPSKAGQERRILVML